MKQITFLILAISIFITSCSNDPQKLLKQTQIKMLGYESLNYNQILFQENFMGTYDTLENSIFLSKNEKSLIGYDVIIKTEETDYVNIDGDPKFINHSDKTVQLRREGGLSRKYSLLTFLKQDGWKFVSDTILSRKKLSDFYNVENDTVIEGNKIYTEQHIFINPNSKLIERSERRNYFKGKLTQTRVYKYLDYNFDKTGGKLTYNFPPDYSTVLYGVTNSNSEVVLKEGEEAPRFSAKDLQNNPFNLEDYRGKKVLLMFSFIGCGYCQMALEQLTQKDYKLSDKVTAIYITKDKQKEFINYVNKITVPFPIIISNAKEIGEKYGVSSYPRFFLIDEKGIIEKIVRGANKEFLNSLKK